MRWLRLPLGTNPEYKEQVFALDPHEAVVLAEALEQPLKAYQTQFEELNLKHHEGTPTTREEDYKRLLLEEIIDMASEFIAAVSNEKYKP